MANLTRVGFIGDIVGRAGRSAVMQILPKFKREFELDFIVANAENASGGFGLTATNAHELLGCGIDAITGGNHSFDKKDVVALMDALPIIRPYNHFAGTAGRGAINLSKEGKSLSVVNLMGHYGLPHTNNAFLEAERALGECESENILIDFHAEATSEKNAFFRLFCGRVGAIAGTHTHVGTDDLQILNGTAYVSDVGLSGAFDGVIGMDAEAPVKSFLTGLKHSFKVNEKCRRIFQMVVFEFDGINEAIYSGAVSQASLQNAFNAALLYEKSEDVIKEFLRAGVNLNYGFESSLFFALKNLNNVKLLVASGADVNYENLLGVTPLFKAVQLNDINLVKFLLENGALVNKRLIDMSTKLAYSANLSVQLPSFVKLCDFDEASKSVLMSAAGVADVEILQLLVDNGADVQAVDDNGLNALDYAIIGKKEINAQYLRAMGLESNLITE